MKLSLTVEADSITYWPLTWAGSLLISTGLNWLT